MSISRRLMVTQRDLEPFEFELTVGNNQAYILPVKAVNTSQPNISVDWGDGAEPSNIISETDPNRYHVYSTAGTYTVSIQGSMPGFKVNYDSYRLLYTAVTTWGDVGVRDINFYGCQNLTSIPGGAFGLNRVTRFNYTFSNTGISSIPSDLFSYATSAIEFTDTFSFTNITTIPNQLFDFCVNSETFNSTFFGCTGLTGSPQNLFRYNTSVISFVSTFQSCTGLLTIPTFQYNLSVTNFSSVFNMPSGVSNGSGNWGSVDELWNREPEPLGTSAFKNCTGITNYADIPFNWK